MCNLDEVKRAMQPNTSLVWIESPTNPYAATQGSNPRLADGPLGWAWYSHVLASDRRMQVTDIAACADIARAGGALSMVDNSIMAPVFQVSRTE